MLNKEKNQQETSNTHLLHSGRGRGCGHGNHKPNVPPQAKVDKCVHITKTYYPPDVYAKFTPAEKHKLWQNQKCQRERMAGGRTPPDPNSNRSRLAKMASNMSVDRDLDRYSNPDQRRIRFVDDDLEDDLCAGGRNCKSQI